MNCTNNNAILCTSSDVEPAVKDLMPNTTSASNVSTSPVAVAGTTTPTAMDYVIVCAIVVGCVGFLGNAFCVSVIVGHKPLRARLANYYIINQCVLDFIISVLLLTNMTTVGSYVVSTDVLGTLTCYLWKSRILFTSLLASSSFNVVALTIERYFEVIYPIKHKLYFNRRIVVVSIAAVWIIAIVLKMGDSFSTFKVSKDGICLIGVVSNDYEAYIITITTFLFEYFICLVVIAFCYIRMGHRMMRSIQPSRTSSSSSASQDSTALRARKNILKTLLSVVVCMAATSSFKQILILGYGFHMFDVDWRGNVYKISAIVQFSNCCINPFIYMFQYKEFQKGVVVLFLSGSKKAETSVTVTQDTRIQF